MAHEPPQHDFRRARSDAQKQERRRDILQAARLHLAEVGVDGFAMAPLGKAAGVSRAALYLYFANREEVLLALYLEETRAWLDELAQITTAAMAVDDYLRAVFSSATRRPLFMALAPRATSLLEGNVAVERLIESKRLSATLVDVAGRRTALALGRPLERSVQLALALFALMLGVNQTLREPTVDIARLPPDVQAQLAGEPPIDAFVRIGRWLVEGSR
jgi:AcrR family transcriptional regulator